MALVHIIQIEAGQYSFNRVANTTAEALEEIRLNNHFATFGAITYTVKQDATVEQCEELLHLQREIKQLEASLKNRDNLAIINTAIATQLKLTIEKLDKMISEVK